MSEVDSFLPRATYKKGLLKESRPDSLEIVQSSCLELLDKLPLKSSCGLSVWTIAALILAQIGCDPFCCYMYHVYPT